MGVIMANDPNVEAYEDLNGVIAVADICDKFSGLDGTSNIWQLLPTHRKIALAFAFVAKELLSGRIPTPYKRDERAKYTASLKRLKSGDFSPQDLDTVYQQINLANERLFGTLWATGTEVFRKKLPTDNNKLQVLQNAARSFHWHQLGKIFNAPVHT